MFLRRFKKLMCVAKDFHQFLERDITRFPNHFEHLKSIASSLHTQIPKQDISEEENIEIAERKNVIDKINNQIHSNSHGRLFAVIHICGKQFKVTDEDLIMVQGNWAPTIGDKIRLEKVLLVGSKDFTLVGRPMLPKDQVAVYGTIVEKTFSPTIMVYRKRPKKRFTFTSFSKVPYTFVRITSVELKNGVDEIGDVDGLDDRIF